MNEPKRKLLGGGRANPRDTQGRKVGSNRDAGSRIVLAALKLWEAKNRKKPHPFNAYYQPEKGQ